MAEEIQEEEILQGPGAMLKERRESLQLSIEDIANKLHLRPAVVAELENDIIDHAVSMTFTKGYVRLYAKHLEIDPAPVLEAFNKLANPISQPAKLQSFSQKMAKQASDTRLMMFSYFILFVVIAMAVIWWFQLPGGSNETTDINQTTDISTEIVTSDSNIVSETLSSAVQTEIPLSSASQNTNVQGNNAVSEQASAQGELLDQREAVIGTANAVIERFEQPESSFANQESTLSDMQSSSTVRNTTEPVGFQDVDSEDVDSDEQVLRQNSPQESNPSENDLSGNDSNENNPENINSQPGSFRDQNVELIDASSSSSNGEQAQFDDANTVDPATQEIVFTFLEDCWMNLTDATGENIAYGVKSAGRVMPVTGIPPFDVVLGAPQGVQISVNGVSFDMEQFPAGRTARFTIGE